MDLGETVGKFLIFCNVPQHLGHPIAIERLWENRLGSANKGREIFLGTFEDDPCPTAMTVRVGFGGVFGRTRGEPRVDDRAGSDKRPQRQGFDGLV